MKPNNQLTMKTCCTKVAKYICEHLDEKFDSPRCKHIREHLQECEECSQVLKELKVLISLYRSTPCPQLPQRTQKKRIQTVLKKLKARKRS